RLDLGRLRLLGLPRSVDDAVRDVVLQQAETDRLERLGGCGDLRQDVDAVGVVVDHLGDAADLSLDACQPLEVVVLGTCVSVHSHGDTIPPYGMWVQVSGASACNA